MADEVSVEVQVCFASEELEGGGIFVLGEGLPDLRLEAELAVNFEEGGSDLDGLAGNTGQHATTLVRGRGGVSIKFLTILVQLGGVLLDDGFIGVGKVKM